MKTTESKSSTSHSSAPQKPFFGASPDHAFFSTERAQPTPFFQPLAVSNSNIQAKSATSDTYVQRMPAYESKVDEYHSLENYCKTVSITSNDIDKQKKCIENLEKAIKLRREEGSGKKKDEGHVKAIDHLGAELTRRTEKVKALEHDLELANDSDYSLVEESVGG